MALISSARGRTTPRGATSCAAIFTAWRPRPEMYTAVPRPEDVHSRAQTRPCNLIKFLKTNEEQKCTVLFFFLPFNKLFIMVGMMDHSLGQRIDYVILFKICSHIEQADWKSYGSIFQKKCLGFSQ